MARLALSEQLAALTQAHSALQEQYLESKAVAQTHLKTIESLQEESARLWPLQETTRLQAAKIAELEKTVKEKSNSYDYKYQELKKAEGEIEQAHAVLDGVAGAPSREYEQPQSYGGTATRQRNVVTRLAGAFLAIAQKTPTALG